MATFDMPPRPASFEDRGGWLCRALAAEFNLTLDQAAGIVGNLGFESGGFEKLHEIGQPDGVGGYGWGQWTAGRRVTFLGYAQAHGLDWQSDAANYGYLVEELRGGYHNTIVDLMSCSTVEQAVWSVGQTYERPGGTTRTNLPGYAGRLEYARRARAGVKSGAVPSVAAPMPATTAAVAIPPCRDLQAALIAAGFDLGDTGADGDWGDLSAAALRGYYRSV